MSNLFVKIFLLAAGLVMLFESYVHAEVGKAKPHPWTLVYVCAERAVISEAGDISLTRWPNSPNAPIDRREGKLAKMETSQLFALASKPAFQESLPMYLPNDLTQRCHCLRITLILKDANDAVIHQVDFSEWPY